MFKFSITAQNPNPKYTEEHKEGSRWEGRFQDEVYVEVYAENEAAALVRVKELVTRELYETSNIEEQK